MTLTYPNTRRIAPSGFLASCPSRGNAAVLFWSDDGLPER